MNSCVYHIQLCGQVDVEEVNEMSPLLLVREGRDREMAHLSVNTDQSGLIGLMRHLHGLGFVFQSVNCER